MLTDKETREVYRVLFNRAYSDLVNIISQLKTANHVLVSHALMNLDQGAFWAREAISILTSFDEPKIEENKVEEEVKETKDQPVQ